VLAQGAHALGDQRGSGCRQHHAEQQRNQPDRDLGSHELREQHGETAVEGDAEDQHCR
jgi:hypothetical protein